ncbi:cyclin-like protein [Dipodascopsis uninucleata]
MFDLMADGSQMSTEMESRRSPSTEWPNQQHTDWIFQTGDLLNTPSSRDGIDSAAETVLRSKGVSFLMHVGMHLRLPQPTLYVASTLFHRFYMRFSLKRHHHYDIGATCIFLASKIEENIRKLRDIVIACCRVAQKNEKLVIDENNKEFWRWRDIILFNEELLLEAICFDLSIETPYSIMMYYTRKLLKTDDERSALSKSSWAFLNDSVRTTICLIYPAKVIAAASMYFASKICHIEISGNDPSLDWWDEIRVSVDDLKNACNAMADLYDSGSSNSGEQQYKKIKPV